MSDIKVLIVEDDNELATMYKFKFEKEGFIVKIADNGLSAITEVTEFEPNVVLLDIMMPSMDGFETLRVIRQLAPSLGCKIIMFSNLNSKEDIDKCTNLGADAYLLKANTTPKEATEKIYELVSISKQERQMNVDKSEHKKYFCPHCDNEINLKIDIYK